MIFWMLSKSKKMSFMKKPKGKNYILDVTGEYKNEFWKKSKNKFLVCFLVFPKYIFSTKRSFFYSLLSSTYHFSILSSFQKKILSFFLILVGFLNVHSCSECPPPASNTRCARVANAGGHSEIIIFLLFFNKFLTVLSTRYGEKQYTPLRNESRRPAPACHNPSASPRRLWHAGTELQLSSLVV